MGKVWDWLTEPVGADMEQRKHRDLPGGAAVTPPPRSSLATVDVNKALSLSAIYRSVMILQAAGEQLPLKVYRNDEVIESRLADRPDINEQRSDFFGTTILSMALYGTAFWNVTRDSNDQVINIAVIDPNKLTVDWEDPNALVPRRRIWFGERNVTNQVRQLSLSRMPDELIGKGPIQRCWSDIHGMLQLRTYSDQYFSVGSPVGILSADQPLNQEAATKYREVWEQTMSQRTVAVLGQGMTYSPIYADSTQAQLADHLKASTAMAARIFGIPAQMLGAGLEGSSLVYATAEGLMRGFLQTSLTQYLSEIEGEFTDLLPRGQTARFDMDALLRADTAGRVAAWEKFIQLGVLTEDEVRIEEGYGPGAPGRPEPAPAVEEKIPSGAS